MQFFGRINGFGRGRSMGYDRVLILGMWSDQDDNGNNGLYYLHEVKPPNRWITR